MRVIVTIFILSLPLFSSAQEKPAQDKVVSRLIGNDRLGK